jgi:PTS system galactitol-specific IIA component
MINRILVVDGEAENACEAIKITGSELLKNGFVKEGFIDACIDREKSFPTGLPTEIGVAIPHCDAEYVIEPAICVLRLGKPVLFENMGGEEPVRCEFVMNLALHKQEDQVVLLRKIIGIIQDRMYMENIKKLSTQEVAESLMERIKNNG